MRSTIRGDEMDENNNLENEPKPIEVADEDIFEPEPIPEPEPDTTFFEEERDHYQAPPRSEDYTAYGGGNSQGGEYHYSGQQGGQQYRQPHPRHVSKTLGILSLVFGIVSLVFFCSCFNIVTGIAAIVFGIIQLVQGHGVGKGISIAGIVTGALSIVLFFIFWGLIFGNGNIRDSILDQYGEDGMQEFFENLPDDYFGDYDFDFNFGGSPGGTPGPVIPDTDGASQL